MIGLFLAAVGSVYADSQLAAFYQALAKDPRSPEPTDLDPFKMVPSEEIPVIVSAVKSGNQVLMDSAVREAITILRIHKIDGENPNFRRLKPPLAEVIQEFQPLIPALTAHFDDAEPNVPGAISNDDFPNTPWKIQVIRFLDLIGTQPTPRMVDWMLTVVKWPNGRAQDYVARIEKDSVSPGTKATHDAFLRTMMDHFRSQAIGVAPLLAHLNPMPPFVAVVLLNKVDDLNEPLVAAAVIKGMADNKTLGPEIADRLVLRALDKNASVDVRVAAIHAIKRLRPSVIPRLAELRSDPDDRITLAMADIGAR